MNTLTRIRIPAGWANNPSAVADFKLGLGPCGRVVTYLEVTYGDHFVKVEQVTSADEHSLDDETKIFRYHYSQLTGRIEETYVD